MPDEDQLPPAAVMITHPVADFGTWKAGFDAHEGARRGAGILGHHLNRSQDDPNSVSIYMALSDLDRGKAFASSPDLKSTMEDLGVTGPPDFMWMTPMREAVVWDRELPAMVVTHTVADFDAWLEGYNAADGLRASKGIVGHAANRSLDDPSLAIIYHQAETFEELRSFLEDPDLQAAMQQAGATSKPDVSYSTGGWSKQYD
jgi:hypothetical protein